MQSFRPTYLTSLAGVLTTGLCGFVVLRWGAPESYFVGFCLLPIVGLFFLKQLLSDFALFNLAAWRETPKSWQSYRSSSNVVFIVSILLFLAVIFVLPSAPGQRDVIEETLGISAIFLVLPVFAVVLLGGGWLLGLSSALGRNLLTCGGAMVVATIVSGLIEVLSPKPLPVAKMETQAAIAPENDYRCERIGSGQAVKMVCKNALGEVLPGATTQVIQR